MIVDYAHIRAAEIGGPRYDARMTDDERRDVSNIMLFCPPHHDMVDDRPDWYSVEMLLRWKTQREAAPHEALERLREVTPAGLRSIVAESLEDHDERMLEVLDRLQRSDKEAAALMRGLVDELTEAYSLLKRRALDPVVVEEFSRATKTLREIAGKGQLSEFAQAVRTLARRFPNGLQ
ncbi:hypothetical protein [Streptosporangium sandarakinum]|uniref:HNH endonuclease n=1 Tax=Streptosporangium sandarakinum TaxID=1260955 RepID=A0A852VED6_9ACTN|nr:hypothetical protein [Streptosporangium sandarakinum]NYF44555.1 hypothetical protein [Streptosporangium sandarakinum]